MEKAIGSSGTAQESGPSDSNGIPLKQALGGGFVQKFEILGIANLLFLQANIQRAKNDLIDTIKRTPGYSGNRTEDAATDDSSILDLVLSIVDGSSPDPGLEDQANKLERLMRRVQEYNKAILQQRKILSLPAYDIVTLEAGKRGKYFRHFNEKTLPKRFQYDDADFFKNNRVVHKSKWGTGEYVSLDPCTCSKTCPTGFAELANIGSWTPANVPENSLKLLGLVLLSMIPTGTILVLYAVPSIWGRLGFIVGESAIVIAVMARKLADNNVLAYMIGIAAVQVVFVGSVISSK